MFCFSITVIAVVFYSKETQRKKTLYMAKFAPYEVVMVEIYT